MTFLYLYTFHCFLFFPVHVYRFITSYLCIVIDAILIFCHYRWQRKNDGLRVLIPISEHLCHRHQILFRHLPLLKNVKQYLELRNYSFIILNMYDPTSCITVAVKWYQNIIPYICHLFNYCVHFACVYYAVEPEQAIFTHGVGPLQIPILSK